MTLDGVDAGDGGQEGEGIETASAAVRALCEFTAKRGDLDLRFTPEPTALEGIEGHQQVAQVDHVVDARAKEIVGGGAGKQHGRYPKNQHSCGVPGFFRGHYLAREISGCLGTYKRALT